jgi:hypothetical protein
MIDACSFDVSGPATKMKMKMAIAMTLIPLLLECLYYVC